MSKPKCKTCGGKEEILSDKSTKYITITVPCPDCAEQPPDAPSVAPDAERPSTRPAVPSESLRVVPRAEDISGLHEHIARLEAQLAERGRLITGISEANEDLRLQIIRLETKLTGKDEKRQAWDKMAKATESGEFTKLWRIPDAEVHTYNHKIINKACDIIDCLEKEAKTTVGTNVRLKAEYNKLQAQLTAKNKEIDRLEAKIKHTVDFCKVQVAMGAMSVSAAADITGLPRKEVEGWLKIDTEDCKNYYDALAKVKQIVKEQEDGQR